MTSNLHVDHEASAPNGNGRSDQPDEVRHPRDEPTSTVTADRLEEALRAEERYRTLVEGASDGIFISDASGHYLDVNPAGCEMLGYSRAEILGLTIENLIAPEEVPRLLFELNRLGGGGVPVRSEWRFKRKDGTFFHGEVNARRLPDSRLLAVLRDITPLQTALHALTESEERFRALIDDLEVGVVLQDAEDHILIANRAAKSWLGLSHEETVGITSRDPRWRLLQEDGSDFPLDRVPSVLAVRTRQPVRNVLIGALHLESTERRWLQVTASPRLRADGTVQHVLVTIIDITERRIADQRLRESQRHLLASQHVGRVGSWELHLIPDTDRDLGGLRWSDECYRVFGFEPGKVEVTNEVFWSRVHPDDREAVKLAVQRAIEHNEIYEIDHRIVLDDHSVRVIHERGELVNDPVTAAGMKMIGTSQDITDRLQLEEQLRQSQKMQAVGQLAGGVAHDFNNVLTVISNYSDLLAQDLADASEPVREAVRAIRDAGRRASLLTRQLLLFSRKAVVEPHELDLNEVVRQTSGMLRRLIPEDIEISVALDATPPHILADRGQMEQVVLNLALNARDAMPRGGRLSISTDVTVLDEEWCRAWPDSRPGRFVRLVVSDTGSGMTPDVRTHLFEPFFTTKPQGHGTGLGLATVYGIVRAGGGFITVRTEVDQGTTFTIFMPALSTEDGRGTVVREERPRRRGNETVLLVEDEPEVRQVARRVLESAGYRVVEADSGKAALALFETMAEQVDLLLSDIVMPEMSGRELASQVRARYPKCRVLLMSGYFDEAAGERGAPDGLPFLQKPFTLASLVEKVREVLDQPA
jgi:two-component system cell cycle sensor histidine kinase/response regulator CckA